MTSQATGIMKHMIAFIDEQSAKLLSESSGLKPLIPKEALPEDIPFEEDDFRETGFKELHTRLEKSIHAFDQHAKSTGKQICIFIESIDQLDASTIRDNLLFLPRDLPSTIRIVISCVNQFDLSFWKDHVINMTNLKDDGEIDGILSKQLSSYGKKAEKSLTDSAPFAHMPDTNLVTHLHRVILTQYSRNPLNTNVEVFLLSFSSTILSLQAARTFTPSSFNPLAT